MVNDKRDTCVQFSVGGTKMKRIGYKHTVAASFTAFVVQAVVNNFAPLLFLTFQAQYGIELSKITVLITANFFIQIFVDLTAVLFVDRIGYRVATGDAAVHRHQYLATADRAQCLLKRFRREAIAIVETMRDE